MNLCPQKNIKFYVGIQATLIILHLQTIFCFA